jgi:hypothetical protein
MSLEVVPRAETTQAGWDALVRGSPDGWVFSLWGWQELILAVETWALEDHSFAIHEGRRLLAVVPLQYHPGSGRMGSTGWGGSGPVIDGRLDGDARNNLMGLAIRHGIQLARERGSDGFDISLSPVTTTSISSAWGVNPLVFHGLEDRSGFSQVIDLSKSEDELWADLSSDARRQIKQARQAGHYVERVNWPEHVDRYYYLHTATYRRTGALPHQREYFVGIADHTASTGNSVLWAVHRIGGEVVAYHNASWFGAGASYHTGCSTVEDRDTGASYLLFWEAMLGAKQAGMLWYECGAIFPGPVATQKQKGLSTFKTKFGGQTHRQFVCGLNFPRQPTASSAVSPEPTFIKRIVGKILGN